MSRSFSEALQANQAIQKCIDLASDPSMAKSARDAYLSECAGQYCDFMGISAADGAERLAKVTGRQIAVDSHAGASGAPVVIRKTVPTEPVRMATRAELLAKAREAVAGQVAEIRKVAPHLSDHQARSRVFAAHPGLRKELVELDGREYGRRGPSQDFAKAERVSSAQIEAVAKAAELRQENPRLSEHQALDRVYKARPDLLSRLLAERRGAG